VTSSPAVDAFALRRALRLAEAMARGTGGARPELRPTVKALRATGALVGRTFERLPAERRRVRAGAVLPRCPPARSRPRPAGRAVPHRRRRWQEHDRTPVGGDDHAHPGDVGGADNCDNRSTDAPPTADHHRPGQLPDSAGRRHTADDAAARTGLDGHNRPTGRTGLDGRVHSGANEHDAGSVDHDHRGRHHDGDDPRSVRWCSRGAGPSRQTGMISLLGHSACEEVVRASSEVAAQRGRRTLSIRGCERWLLLRWRSCRSSSPHSCSAGSTSDGLDPIGAASTISAASTVGTTHGDRDSSP
jgi:hypothetical protein